MTSSCLALRTFFKNIISCLCLYCIFVAARGPSLVVDSEGYSLSVVQGILLTVASLLEECGLCGKQSSIVVA